MKKLWHYGAISLVFGFVLLLLVYFMTGGNLGNLSRSPSKTVMKQADFSGEDIKDLDLNVSAVNVEIIGTDRDQIKIAYPENNEVKYEVANKGGSLVVKEKARFRFSFIIDLVSVWQEIGEQVDMMGNKVTITLPKEELAELKAEVDGDINIESLSIKGDTELKTDGKTDIDGLTVGGQFEGTAYGALSLSAVDVKGDTKLKADGQMDIDGLTVGDQFEGTAYGALSLSAVDVKGDTKLKADGQTDIDGLIVGGQFEGTAYGALSLSVVNAQSVKVSSDGNLTLNETKVADSLIAKADSSDIELDNVDVGKSLDLVTDGGNIRGRLAGRQEDYSITSQAEDGKNNLPNGTTGGSRTLSAKVDSGDIDIQFAD